LKLQLVGEGQINRQLHGETRRRHGEPQRKSFIESGLSKHHKPRW
jgi:hypothetical protein